MPQNFPFFAAPYQKPCWLSCILYLQHFISQRKLLVYKTVYLFPRFSCLGNVYLFIILTSSLMFSWCLRFARSRSLPHGIAFDSGRLLEITALLPRLNYNLFPFKFSLIILCTIRQSVVMCNLCLHTGSLKIYLLIS